MLSDLAPVVLAAAGDGDAVAAGLVDDLGDEFARMVVALVRRLDVDTSGRNGIPVVLGGGYSKRVIRDC